MKKLQWISIILKILSICAAVGIGIWYLSSSIGGDALTYTSVDNFMTAINTNGDISNNGKGFLGTYIVDLLNILGDASEMFWNGIVHNLWILMAAGFAIFMFISAIKYLWEKMQKNAEYSDKANDLDFKTWFDPVWKLGLRVAIAAAVIGAMSINSEKTLNVVSDILISPILYIGSILAMATTSIGSHTNCDVVLNSAQLTGAMSALSGSFMCVIGNLHAIMLAGAAGGFALMNYAWLGLGGGLFTWASGLLVVLGFLIIGFDLFFQIFSVLFKVVFVIIFLPVLIAAAAYETVWKAASGLFRKSLEMVIQAAISVISITLKIVILFSIVYYAADSMFPGPVDSYTSVLPPMFEQQMNPDADNETKSVMHAFSVCEASSKDADGNVDADLFKPCFLHQKEIIERQYPDAFDFLKNGWSFFITMVGLFLLYYYVVNPKIDKLLPAGKVKLPIIHGEETDMSTGQDFDIGKWTYDVGQKIWRAPRKLFDGTVQKLKDNGFIK